MTPSLVNARNDSIAHIKEECDEGRRSDTLSPMAIVWIC